MKPQKTLVTLGISLFHEIPGNPMQQERVRVAENRGTTAVDIPENRRKTFLVQFQKVGTNFA
ncbi:MAG: hypothetical protein IJ719_10980 [Clostridia bacterium]|nr:hypothetical protein [Clostridia bacterium]